MMSWVHICHPKFYKLAQVTIVTGHRVCGMGQHYEMSWVCRCMPCQLHLWGRLHQCVHTQHASLLLPSLNRQACSVCGCNLVQLL